MLAFTCDFSLKPTTQTPNDLDDSARERLHRQLQHAAGPGIFFPQKMIASELLWRFLVLKAKDEGFSGAAVDKTASGASCGYLNFSVTSVYICMCKAALHCKLRDGGISSETFRNLAFRDA